MIINMLCLIIDCGDREKWTNTSFDSGIGNILCVHICEYG